MDQAQPFTQLKGQQGSQLWAKWVMTGGGDP